MTVLIIFGAIVIVAAVLAIYFYTDRCRQLRKELSALGIAKDEKLSFPKGYNLWYLKDRIYEKETELAEECFVASADGIGY